MASIESLLNPLPEFHRFSIPSPSLSSSTSTAASSRGPRHKKPKLAKDAPIFTKGNIRGELRYPPCEERDEELARLHREFQLHPIGHIADFPRHIPYNSDKKSFQERTGRESFEVFQYTFKIPGQDREWTVMWDYNIGLVRTTHLFKCNNYSKTTPAKMLNLNPGLREICHSITGGALAAQGYWMPFEAAKAVAATFCWNIRHALTPLFGNDFPSLCIHPQDRRHYERWTIDPEIVKKATETSKYYRMLELQSTSVPSLDSTSRRPSPPEEKRFRRQIPPKSHYEYADSVSSSGYGSSYSSLDFGPDTYCVSPVSPYRNTFTTVNTPRSTEVVCTRIPSPQHVLATISDMSEKVVSDEDCGSDVTESTMYSDFTSTATDSPSMDLDDTDGRDNDNKSDEDYREHNSRRQQEPPVSHSGSNRNIETRSRLKPRSVMFAREVRAAHALLSLHMQDATASDVEDCQTLCETSGRKRRRASA